MSNFMSNVKDWLGSSQRQPVADKAAPTMNELLAQEKVFRPSTPGAGAAKLTHLDLSGDARVYTKAAAPEASVGANIYGRMAPSVDWNSVTIEGNRPQRQEPSTMRNERQAYFNGAPDRMALSRER